MIWIKFLQFQYWRFRKWGGKMDFIPSHVHSLVQVHETLRRPLSQRSTALNHPPLASAGSVSVSPAVCPSSLLPDPSTLHTVYPPGPASEWFFHYRGRKKMDYTNFIHFIWQSTNTSMLPTFLGVHCSPWVCCCWPAGGWSERSPLEPAPESGVSSPSPEHSAHPTTTTKTLNTAYVNTYNNSIALWQST